MSYAIVRTKQGQFEGFATKECAGQSEWPSVNGAHFSADAERAAKWATRPLGELRRLQERFDGCSLKTVRLED